MAGVVYCQLKASKAALVWQPATFEMGYIPSAFTPERSMSREPLLFHADLLCMKKETCYLSQLDFGGCLLLQHILASPDYIPSL